MCRDKTIIICSVLLGLLLFTTNMLVAQDEQKTPGYNIKVSRFLDYISVTDQDGKLVKDLKVKDFVVKVNGQVVKVEDLLLVESSTRSSETYKRALREATGDANSAEFREKFPPKHYILFFDLFNNRPPHSHCSQYFFQNIYWSHT